ncbi:MAG: transcriptional repressor NrdR [bacterium]|nr:MAG: transcriptional repressor NrdR [bacterium]MBI4621331.1 transcriptional repressor NrdR [Desulfobacterales bacterium]RJP60153.1 MAG: transcriptional repressor NrdR [Deltaproteobacteria bacterium]
MKCPFCSNLDNRVIDSRLSKDGNIIRRRRECLDCKERFTTYERVEEVLPSVVKKDGRREPFDRTKIFNGIKRACEKRPVSINAIENVVDEIEREFQDSGEKEIKCSDIGERVMRALHDLDAVAYVRFASVYRQFKDVSDFMVEVRELLGGQKETKKE